MAVCDDGLLLTAIPIEIARQLRFPRERKIIYANLARSRAIIAQDSEKAFLLSRL